MYSNYNKSAKSVNTFGGFFCCLSDGLAAETRSEVRNHTREEVKSRRRSRLCLIDRRLGFSFLTMKKSKTVEEILDEMEYKRRGRQNFAERFLRTNMNSDEQNTYYEAMDREDIENEKQ